MAGKSYQWTGDRKRWLITTVGGQIAATGRVDWQALARGAETTLSGVRCAYTRFVAQGDAVAVSALTAAYRAGEATTIPPAPPAPPAADPEPIDPIAADMERRERLRQLREEKRALDEVSGEKSFRALLETLCERYAPPIDAPPRYVPPRQPKGASCETVIQKLSDLHGGEEVSREGTRGFNEFSTPILAQRLKRVIDSHLAIKARMERGNGWAFRKLVIALNGDLVSGTIHEIERHSDTKNIIWAVFAVGHLLAQAIRDLAGQYAEVEVFCTSGNHGRLPDARRMQQKDPTRNWDTMVAMITRAQLANLRHVQWYIPDSYSVAYAVEGWNFCQTHGHDVKSWNSIPWYGLNRLVGNINALEASRSQTIHYWLFGHFHNPSSLGHASGESFINGSLIGGTEWTINALGKADKPCQWMLGVHRDHGVTFRFPLSGLGEGEGYEVPEEALAA